MPITSFLTTRIRALLLAVVGVVGAATAAVALVPEVAFAYRGQSAQVAIETAATMVSLLAAFILFGRLQESSPRSELLLFVGLVLLFAANLARSLAGSYTGDNGAVVWVPLSANVIAGVVLAMAAVAPDRGAGRWPRELAGGILAGAGLAMFGAYVVSDQLAIGIDPAVSPRDSDAILVTGSAGLLAVQAASMALFTIAAVGFARRAERTGDELLAWIAIGMALAAMSRLNYFLFPSIYSEWVFSGDVLRFSTYLVILVGALRQIAAYQRAAATAAVVEERSRIAADLHDGLAQDLAFLAMQSERLSAHDERLADFAEVARHALAESRGAIENLQLTDAPIAPALASIARGLASRHRTSLVLDLDEGLEATPQVRDQLLRIAGEAITNAIRHGRPAQINVRLSGEHGQIRLSVLDDGAGFDPETAAEGADGGLGLPGMRRRTERLGGVFRVRSQPGKGTSVEVVVP